MALEEVRVRHIHIPEMSIPDDDRSDIESRAVAWRIEVVKGRQAVVDVVTGRFSFHKDLAGHVADEAVTRFSLPKSMSHESAVLIGLLSDEGKLSVVCTTHGHRGKSRLGDDGTHAILHWACAGVAGAVQRGYELDYAEPPETPYDLDQLPEPVTEEFDVTPEMLAAFDRAVEDQTIALHEEIVPDVPAEKAAAQALVKEFLKEYAVRGDVLSE